MGFCQWAEMGPKVGFGGAKEGQKWVDTHFSPTQNPSRDFCENPLFTQLKGGLEKLFSKKGPEAVPTQHKRSQEKKGT